MSQNATLRKILEAVYKMAVRKRKANESRPVGRYIEGVQGEGFRYRREPVLYTNAFPVSTRGDTGGEARYRGDLGGGLDDHESVGIYGFGFP